MVCSEPEQSIRVPERIAALHERIEKLAETLLDSELVRAVGMLDVYRITDASPSYDVLWVVSERLSLTELNAPRYYRTTIKKLIEETEDILNDLPLPYGLAHHASPSSVSCSCGYRQEYASIEEFSEHAKADYAAHDCPNQCDEVA